MALRRIGVFTPDRENAQLTSELYEAFERVLRSGRYLLGPELEALESSLAHFLGVRHFVGVGSGTDAIILALQALGIGPGEEVIVPAFGAVPTAAAVLFSGATPVFADVDAQTGCMGVREAAAAIGPKTAGLILVHLYGYPGDVHGMASLCSKHGIAFIEDCAQAFGAFVQDSRGKIRVGTVGEAGCFSFYPTKVLAALGDAGGIATNDGQLAAKCRLLRSHGHVGDYRHEIVARNSRMDELQAAFLRVKLARAEKWAERRRHIAARLRSFITEATKGDVVFQPDALGHAYHLLAARHSLRDKIVARCAEAGLELLVHYPLSIAEQGAYKGFARGEYPEASRWASSEFSLTTSPNLADDEVKRVATLVSEAVASAEAVEPEPSDVSDHPGFRGVSP